ncbi:MAG: hypothetical protein AAF768_11850 [Pseudomonadota bacterium]
MLKLKLCLVLLLSLAAPQPAIACTCSYAGDFIEFSGSAIVVEGQIRSYGPRLSHGETLHASMWVNVEEVVKGKYRHSSIEFVGDPGHLCLTYIDAVTYPLGSKHLFAVFVEDQKQQLVGCGEVSVQVVNGIVHGISFTNGVLEAYSVDRTKFVEQILD